LAIYGGLVYHPFHTFDDPGYVHRQLLRPNGLTFEGCAWAFRSVECSYWHPLTWLSHMTDVEVFGPNPAGHYLTNILLHVASSLFALLARLARWRQRADGIVVALNLGGSSGECRMAWRGSRRGKSLLADGVHVGWNDLLPSFIARAGAGATYLLSIVAHLLASMAKPIAVLFPVAWF